MDKGYSGLVSTLQYLDDADISHTGTYASEEDQQKILIKNVKGVTIAFLSFTYGTNGITIPSDKSYAVNLIDEDLILEQLQLAKEENPDLICVSMHWGTEYQTTPNSTQTKLADLLFNNGADIIIGNHPHVIQKMEKRTIELEDGSTKDGFVVYSLGNFMADQSYKYTRDSAILNLKITKNAKTGKISIDSAEYTPTYIYNSKTGSTQKFKILDIKSTIASYQAGVDTSITKTTYNTLVTELENIQNLLGDEIK
jgi:poly-gamma-glutamate synthesis protein (capsule biosynthesis protein)